MAGGSTRRTRFVLPGIVAVIALIVMVGVLPATASASVLTACSGVFAVMMARAVATGRAAGTHLRALSLAGGILITALAGAASGISLLVAPHVLVGGGVPLPAEIPLVSLFFVAGAYLPVTLRPHQRRDLLGRLRAGLDILGLTACLIFTPWLLLSSGTEQRGATMTALILGATAAATVAVSGVHAIRHRAALQWCGPGAALSLIGLTALVIGMDYQQEPNAMIGAVAGGFAINVAAGLMWYGSVRIRPDVRPIPPAGSDPSAGFPLLALPILGSALVTVYHVITHGRLDTVTIVLGTVAITAVATREWVSAIALRRHADHLSGTRSRWRSSCFAGPRSSRTCPAPSSEAISI